MSLTVEHAYWATLLLAVPAAAFLMRLFMIQHDCGHRSFFRSRRLNDLPGSVIGVLTLTPHRYWRPAHNTHHATSGNLEKRGVGAVSVDRKRGWVGKGVVVRLRSGGGEN